MRADQEAVARNLLLFPTTIKVRGIFFEGVSRIVAESHGPDAMAGLAARAGIAPKITAFRAYPHRDFYKLYYLAARLLASGDAAVRRRCAPPRALSSRSSRARSSAARCRR